MRIRPVPIALAFAVLLSALPCLGAEKVLPAQGAPLWDHLTSSDYRKTFTLWPGMKEFAKGKSQHGSLTSIFVNRTALDSINGKTGEMRLGSILVKENYDDAKALQNITVMYKARSYNPSAGNWFWVKYAPGGAIEAEGRVKPCIGCHEEKKANDFVFTGPLK